MLDDVDCVSLLRVIGTTPVWLVLCVVFVVVDDDDNDDCVSLARVMGTEPVWLVFCVELVVVVVVDDDCVLLFCVNGTEAPWSVVPSVPFVTETFRFWIVIVPPLAKSSGGISIGKFSKSKRKNKIFISHYN